MMAGGTVLPGFEQPINQEHTNNLSLRGLRIRAERVFGESRDAMRNTVVLRVQSEFLRLRLDSGFSLPARPRADAAGPALITSRLSPREISVVKLIVNGRTTREIAADLGIAFKTAAAHRSNIMSKLGVTNSAAVVREALRLGITDL